MKKILVVLISIIFVPLSITNFFYEYKDNIIKKGIITNDIPNATIRVLKKDNTVEKIDLEEYLIGVVSAEIPVYFEEEAIKAQAVAARTYALKQMQNKKDSNFDVTDDTSTQVYQSDQELRNKWNDKYDEYISKIKKCVKETDGQYLTYNNEIIYAFFFSTSNGKTEDNKNVFGQDLPYLKIVDSSFDENETSSFIVTKTFSLSEFYEKLGLSYNDYLNIDNIIYTESNRVKSLSINNTDFSGRNFQKQLSLRSNDFTIKKEGESVVITTKGFGHGVGMSQYGANALAKQNKTYDEILKYYYQGTNIQKL